ncbi:hypothetical protein E0Z10_g5021 [Xylaria hypoxylon]|uniref:Uncharacterized protein n=1 Tax=Xylaria hypoxylon TaxID=37992 RepID=A0A4Z0YWH0_9PEZI|nr:hypothetical protein E0Z10_g5021 [Xylaria hypoxylon]
MQNDINNTLYAYHNHKSVHHGRDIGMDNHGEIRDALTSFYELIISIPCLDGFTIATPPQEGWWSIDNTAGKDDGVIDLLRHIPYLHVSSAHLLAIYPGTIPIYYPEPDEGWRRDEDYPLPSHCVYLARREDSLGTDLILDTGNGAVTEFARDNESMPYEEYQALPELERWRAHPTTPLAELLDKWTRMYKGLKLMVSPNPIKGPVAVRFYVQPETAGNADVDYEGGSELDRGQRDAAGRERQHAEKVYNVYVRYGWPDDFKKDDGERLRAELLGLEREMDVEVKRLMDLNNPDAALFDSD